MVVLDAVKRATPQPGAAICFVWATAPAKQVKPICVKIVSE